MLMFTFVMAFVLFYVTRKSDGGCAVPIATDDDDSDASSISKIGNAGRRKQVCNHSSGKPRWRGDGMEWAIERDSVKNKKKYAKKWGYDLEIVDMSTKKRYAHEWRESWEKVDTIRNCLRKYPKAEW